MELDVSIEYKDGKFDVYIGEPGASGYQVFADTIEGAADAVKQYVLDNYKE